MTAAKPAAIVTGASRGIGRAIAIELACAGYNVAVNYHSNRQAADEVAAEIAKAGGQAVLVQGDVGVLADHVRLLDETVAALGPVHLLVNNAGVAPRVRADVLETDEDSYDRVLDTNLKGAFFLTQRVARHMLEQGESEVQHARQIVNISSISAYTASINRAEYCLAKAGIAMMTDLFATRLAAHNINVYEIRPGIIETDMTAGVKDKYDKLIHEDGLTPIPRWGKPSDIALAVRAIAENRFPFSTGQVIDVDGGFHLRRL